MIFYTAPNKLSSENDFYELYIKETLSQPCALPFHYKYKDLLS